MRIHYGDRCMCCTQMYDWNKKLKTASTSVVSSLLGQAITIDIPAVEKVIREKRRVTVKEVASLLDISVGSVHHIIHDELKFQNVCARWVPKRLTPEMRDVSMLVKRFCLGMLGMVKHFSSESSLGIRVGYTSTNRNESDRAWCGATPYPQNRRRCECNDLQAKSC